MFRMHNFPRRVKRRMIASIFFTCIRLGYKKIAITPMFDNEMTWNSKLKLFCTLVKHFWGFGNSLSKFFWETCLGCTISLGESIGAICARTKPYLFSYMYALCTVYAKDIFNLCLGTFAPLTLPSKTAHKSKTCLGCTISLGESIGAICARKKRHIFSH